MRIGRNGASRRIAATALGLAAVTTLAQAQSSGGGLIRDGAAPGLELLYTGDVIGYLDPCG